MKAQRPYLFDAIYQWVLDNNMTPYLLVEVDASTKVPQNLVEDGRIVLNIVPSAIAHFGQDERGITFSARFGGQSQQVEVPYKAMVALYAKENAQGIVFPQEQMFAQATQGEEEGNDAFKGSTDKPNESKKSHLKIIK